MVAVIPVTILWGDMVSPWIIPGLMAGLLVFGAAKRVPVYEAFVEGAKDGFDVAVRIVPYLVALLVAIAMFRASGAMDLLVQPPGLVTAPLGRPPQALPIAIPRPLSGSCTP